MYREKRAPFFNAELPSPRSHALPNRGDGNCKQRTLTAHRSTRRAQIDKAQRPRGKLRPCLSIARTIRSEIFFFINLVILLSVSLRHVPPSWTGSQPLTLLVTFVNSLTSPSEKCDHNTTRSGSSRSTHCHHNNTTRDDQDTHADAFDRDTS